MIRLLEEELEPIKAPAVLFIGTHDSARSIMAAAIAQASLPGSEVG